MCLFFEFEDGVVDLFPRQVVGSGDFFGQLGGGGGVVFQAVQDQGLQGVPVQGGQGGLVCALHEQAAFPFDGLFLFQLVEDLRESSPDELFVLFGEFPGQAGRAVPKSGLQGPGEFGDAPGGFVEDEGGGFVCQGLEGFLLLLLFFGGESHEQEPVRGQAGGA